MDKPRLWLTIGLVAGTAAVIAIVVLARAWLLPGSNPEASPAPESTVPAGQAPIEHGAAAFEFDLQPRRDGVPIVAARVGQVVTMQALELLGDADQADSLGEEVSSRLRVLLDPDFNRWAEEVARFTEPPHPEDSDPSNPASSMSFRERWEASSSGFDMAPMATGGIRVMTIEPDAEPRLFNEIPSAFMRAFPRSSARYPKPQETSQAIEILFPIKYTTMDGPRHDQPAMAALWFFWNDELERWQPYDLMLYMDRTAIGKTVPFPSL